MIKIRLRFLAVLVMTLAFLAPFSGAALAATLDDLLQADRVRIKAWMVPGENLVAYQQISLNIEIATDNRFGGGTRIGAFEVPGAIVLQREKFAVNSIRHEGGKTWTVQQWAIEIYPQRAGRFEIPPIPLQLSIAAEGQTSINGSVSTQPLSFYTSIPDAMQAGPAWIATSSFTIEENYNQPLEGLKPGDALVRTIHMSADNVPAMMLPTIKASQAPGMAAYQDPAQVIDRVNRGYFLAERIETITYLFEKAGQYRIPAETHHWWNLETGQAETASLPAQMLVIAGAGFLENEGETLPQQSLHDKFMKLLPTLYRAGLVLGLLLLTLWLSGRWLRIRRSYSRKTGSYMTESELLKQIRMACRKNDRVKALGYFYRWYDCHGYLADGATVRARVASLNDSELTDSYDQIMQASYSDEGPKNSETCEVFMRIIDAFKKQKKGVYSDRWLVELKLN